MIKSYSLFTSEVDIVETALSDIKNQLSEIKLLSNTVGIVSCHYDHVNSGIIKTLSKELSFPLIGFTTFYQATPKASGLFELTITILTSDDVSFAVGMNANKAEKPLDRVMNTYNKTCQGHDEKPSLIMSFITMKRDVTGDEYMRQMDEASGGIPNFGAVAIGDKDDGDGVFLIYGGEAYNEGFGILLFFGKVETGFYFGNIKKSSVLDKSGVITKATGAVLKEIDDMPATAFIEGSGAIIGKETKAGLLTMPFLFKYKADELDEDIFIARTMYDFNDKGEAVFFGEMPENTSFHIATATSEDIMDIAYETTNLALEENGDVAVIFIFSCIGRYMTIGLDTDTEIEHIKEHIPVKVNYLITYAGGEMCPVKINDRLDNMYHNHSIVLCTIK